MDGKIITKGRMLLLGLSFFGDPFTRYDSWEEENEIGHLWSRFMAMVGREKIQNTLEPDVFFELHLENDLTRIKGTYEVFVGCEVGSLEDPPLHSLVKVLPPTDYAVFTLKGEKVTADWALEIFGQWLPEMGYQRSFPYGLNRYDKRFKGVSRLEESELEVYVPVKKI